MSSPRPDRTSSDTTTPEKGSGAQTGAGPTWHRVMPSQELAPGQLREVRIEGRRVMLGRLRSGEPVATAAACPHQQAPLADGRMWNDAVDCPRHHYLFDLRTGRNLYPLPQYPEWKRRETGDLTLHTHACRDADGWILVSLDNDPKASQAKP